MHKSTINVIPIVVEYYVTLLKNCLENLELSRNATCAFSLNISL